MNLNVYAWDCLLIEAMVRPGESCRLPYQPDATFRWHDYSTPEWSGEQSFQRLGVQLVQPFPAALKLPREIAPGRFDITQGFATIDVSGHTIIGLNPTCGNRIRTVAHELAHVVLRHPQDGYLRDESPLVELAADCAAMLVCFALEQSPAVIADSRTYVQANRDRVTTGSLPTTWTEIKAAATTILTSGIGHVAVADYRRVVDADRARAEVERVRAARARRAAADRRAEELSAFARHLNKGKRR